MNEIVLEINIQAAKLAREEADKFSTPDKWRLVAGAIGPTPKTCSVASNVEDPAYRSTDFEECKEAYKE